MSLWKNKKAQGINYLASIIVLIVFGFCSMLAYTIWLKFIEAMDAGGFYVGQVKITMDTFSNAFLFNDYLVVLLLVFLVIGIGLTSYKLATRTAFFILTLILGVFWGFISYFFNYVFIMMVSPDIFSTAVGLFPRTMIVCTNLHWVMLIYIIVGSLTLYGKKEEGQYLS